MKPLEGKRVLISEPVPQAFETADRLKELGCEVEFGSDICNRDDKRSAEEMKRIVKEYDGFIGMSREKFPREVLEQADRLAIISKYGIGVDHIDLKAAEENGVLVAVSPVNRVPVAEHAVTLMLTLCKCIRKNQRYLNVPNWRMQEMVGTELCGKTIGFVGLGGITREVIARLGGWHCAFIGYDPYVSEEKAAADHVKKVDWDTLFSTADIISLHLPLTADTKGSVGEKEFNLMKTSALFINTARGRLVDQKALIEAVKAGKIAGCGLDVAENEEPIPVEDPIMEIADYDNVIITPHIAGWTRECQQRLADVTTDNIILALQGSVPQNLVNPDAVEVWRRKTGITAV